MLGINEKHDKMKLIYAYAISPLLTIFFVSGTLLSGLSSKYGYDKALQISNEHTLRISMATFISLILPPTILRFIYFGRVLKYGLELYCYICLSLLASSLLFYIFLGVPPNSFGLLGTLSVYCILSYGSTMSTLILKNTRYKITVLTLIAPFLCVYVIYTLNIGVNNIYFPIGEAIILCMSLNSNVPDAEPSKQQDKSPPNYAGTFSTTTDNINDFTNLYDDIAAKLIAIGLSRIGRKTSEPNSHLNSAIDEERKAIERPFLRILAQRYRTDEQRKTLAKHFMLFKEMCLFISYHAILRDDEELHEKVKTELRRTLTDGQPLNAKSLRNKYWYELSKNFYKAYSRSRNMPEALSYSFWRTLSEQHQEFEDVSGSPELARDKAIFEIFSYSYKAIEAEYQGMI